MDGEVVLATYEPKDVPGVIVDLVVLRDDLEAVAKGMLPPSGIHGAMLRVRKT